MTFNALIHRATQSPETRKNILTDGYQSCRYQDLPDAFRSIAESIKKSDIHREDCLALECSNVLPSALLLLYLFSNDCNFVLLPPATDQSIEQDLHPVPKFCRAIITAERPPEGESPSLAALLGQYIRIEENNQFIRSSIRNDAVTEPEPRIYLRTSGSMGSCKIVAFSHANLLGNARNCAQRYRLDTSDRITIPVPISHLYGLGAAFLSGIVAGASIDLQSNTNIIRFLERERRFEPDTVFVVPTLCEMLLAGRRSAKKFKLVVTTGDRLKESTFFSFESRCGRLINQYGSTEMGAIAACESDDALEVRARTVGKPMDGAEVRINTPESGQGYEPADIGEIYCRHPYGFDGYVDEEGGWIGRKTDCRSDWFKTGDLGRIHRNGRLEVLCRCDHSVNRNGRLILFADIEKRMETIEGVENVLVMTGGESKRGDKITAYCAMSAAGREDAEALGKQIRKACFEILPRDAVPDDVIAIRSFPVLPNGKIDRQALIKLSENRTNGI